MRKQKQDARCPFYGNCDMPGMRNFVDCEDPRSGEFFCVRYQQSIEKQNRARKAIAYFGHRIGHFDTRNLGARL
jgi:hypothetical protein